jgi:hypothetical protein
MAKLLGELLFELLGAFSRGAVRSFLEQTIIVKFGTWLDTRIQGRTVRIVLGLLLGVGAYFLIPIVLGLLAL